MKTPAYFDVRRVVDIFMDSGEDEMFYTVSSPGKAINFAQRFNKMRKQDHRDNPGFIDIDRIAVVAVRDQSKVHLSYVTDESGIPFGKFLLADGTEYKPEILADPDGLDLDALAESLARELEEKE